MTSPITKAPETLLPCPFCGNGPVVKKLDHPYWDRAILCTVCYCKTGEYSSGNESHMVAMHDAWNRRAPASAYDSLARERDTARELLTEMSRTAADYKVERDSLREALTGVIKWRSCVGGYLNGDHKAIAEARRDWDVAEAALKPSNTADQPKCDACDGAGDVFLGNSRLDGQTAERCEACEGTGLKPSNEVGTL